jgi:hypothetical protein
MKKKRLDETEDRIRTNITLSREIFNMAVDYKINLSSFLESQLINYFSMRQQILNQRRIQYTPDTRQIITNRPEKSRGKTSDLTGVTSLWGFEPQYPAPKAGRISRLPHRPMLRIGIIHVL